MKLAATFPVVLAFVATACQSQAQDGKVEKDMNATEIATVTTVAPGKVHWHESLAAAIQAAKASKKPVLHFQLLGRLDQELC